MKNTVLALALLASVSGPADTLAFGPKEGTQLEKRFEMRMDLEMRSMSISVGGQDLPSEMTADAQMKIESRQTVVVRDEYKKMDGARPLELARRYVELSEIHTETSQMPGMSEATEEKKEKESDLEDETVLFRWDKEKEHYAKEWVGEGADDALLEGLEEDMDLRRLLPDKGLAVDDTWTIDLDELGEILGPGGDFGFSSEDDDDDDTDEQFEENLKGEAVLTYAGTKTVDGRKLARITAVCTARSFFEEEDEDEEGAARKMRMDITLDLDGEYLWDVEGKHLVSYELEGDAKADMTMTQSLEMGGNSQDLVVKMALAGTWRIEAEVTTP